MSRRGKSVETKRLVVVKHGEVWVGWGMTAKGHGFLCGAMKMFQNGLQ